MSTTCDHKIDSILASPTLLVVPYARHSGFPGDTLHHVYTAMQTAKVMDQVFYEDHIEDLESFVEYMRKALLYIVITRDPVNIVGAAWFTNVSPYRANVGVWYRKEIQGEIGRQISRRICTYIFHTYGWQYIWGLTPWRQAAKHGEKIGFKPIATLPDFVKVGNQLRDLYVIRLENTVCRRNDNVLKV